MEYRKLKTLAKYPTGKLNSNAAVEGGQYPFFTCSHDVYAIDRYSYDGEYVLLGGNNASGDFPIFYYKGKFDAYQRTYLIQPLSQETDTRYLYYSIGLKLKQMKSNASGTATKFLTQPILNNLNIEYRDFREQKIIANILFTYDNLIENNNKRIKLLDRMATGLYKEWFVRRRKVDWALVKLSQLGYSIESGSRPKGGIDDSLQDGYPSLGAEAIGKLGDYDFSSTKLVSAEFYNKLKRGLGRDKDILLYKDGAYIGKVTLFMDEFPYKDYAINEHVFLMRSNDPFYQYYLYFTLALPQYFMQMQNLNRNAAQPGLTGKDLDILKLYQPDEETIKKFNEVVEPILHNIFSLAKQNQNLAKQRDLLLPRLMGGKLEV